MVKMDGKSRIQFPSAFRKQLSSEEQERFMLRTSKDGCLELFPWTTWKRIGEEINSMNPYGNKAKKFQYQFLKGAVEVILDSTSRILIPKKQCEFAGLKDECTLFARGFLIEIWDTVRFERIVGTLDDTEFEEITQSIFDKLNAERTR